MSIHKGLALLFIALLIVPGMATAEEPDAPQALLLQLAGSSGETETAIRAIAASGHERAREWLDAYGNNRLSQVRDTGAVVIVLSNRGRSWEVADAVTGGYLGEMSRRNLERIGVNNAIRRQLGGVMAMMDLYRNRVEVRQSAARDLMGRVDETIVGDVKARLREEPDAGVRESLEQAVAVYELEAMGNVDAVAVLSGSLHPRARAALNGAMASSDPELADAAGKAMASIEQLLKINKAAETLYFGLSMGSVLVLAAIGLAITFGVMGVINMAHGELIMLGAYTTWGMQQLLPGQPGLALILSIPAGFLVAALAGVAIERGCIRFLKGRPLETLLATFGVSLILQQLVRTVISPQNRVVVSPEWMSGSLVINDALSLTLNRLYVLGFALVVFAALMLIMRRTRLGLEVRAVTQNRAMARAMGIRATRVDILTFALGSGVAGLAGVALSQLTNVGPNLGQNYIIDSFMVVVFGGVGNLWGTLVAGLTLGTINQLLEPWAGAVLAKIIVLVFIILFIQKRPKGLFPQKGRAAEA